LDDEPGLTRLGERRLSGLGYAVIGVTSPLKALEALTADPSSFDLVITDYSMPRLNGVELARRIVALRAELPIILLTGYLEDFTSEELTAAGIRRLIKKPVTERELAECVYGIFHS
jgi:CheY-like chemotaxis protein